jgi:hypothetical protein
MRLQINCGGLLIAFVIGCLVSALFGLSFAWCVVIGVGAVPALDVTLRILIWILDRPIFYRIERYFTRRKRAKNQRRIEAAKAKRIETRNQKRLNG